MEHVGLWRMGSAGISGEGEGQSILSRLAGHVNYAAYTVSSFLEGLSKGVHATVIPAHLQAGFPPFILILY